MFIIYYTIIVIYNIIILYYIILYYIIQLYDYILCIIYKDTTWKNAKTEEMVKPTRVHQSTKPNIKINQGSYDQETQWTRS